MDLALSTLLLILALAPGVIFWNSYFSGRFTRQTFSTSPLLEIVSSLAWALVFDAVGIGLLNLVRCLFDHPSIAVAVTSAASPRLALLEHWPELFGTALVTAALSMLAGSTARRIVWMKRWDLQLPILQTRHEWYYLLLGRIRGFPSSVTPYADVLVEHPEERGSRLFRGQVLTFQLTPDGTIREIVLTDSRRASRRGDAFAWMPVPGDRLVLLGPTIHSINLTYADLTPTFDTDKQRRAWERERRWRAFRYEES